MWQHGCLEIARTPIKNGVEVNAPNYDQSTPLHLAIQREHLFLAYCLLQAGANASASDMDGRTPLRTAVGNLRISNALLKHGIYVDSQDKLGRTPLHYTTVFCDFDTAYQLVTWGADIDTIAADNNRQTALQMASQTLENALWELTQERLRAIRTFAERLKQGGNLPVLPADIVNYELLSMMLTTNQRKRLAALAKSSYNAPSKLVA